MTNQIPLQPAPLPPSQPPDRPDRMGAGPPWYVGAVGALLVAILGLVIVLVVRGDDGTEVQTAVPTTADSAPTLPSTDDPSTTATTDPATTATVTTDPATTSTATTAATTASTTVPTTPSTTATTATTTITTTTTVDPAVARSAVWPWPTSNLRFGDPVAAARGFAEDWIGFADPIIGPFQAGDSRSGEVEVRPRPNGPATVIFVRQLGPTDEWWVIGAATESIQVERPDALERVTSPLELAGRSVAFEAAVDVELRVDGSTSPIATGFVMGGAVELGPFAASLPFDQPEVDGGAVLLFTISAEDGRVWEAAVVRIGFDR